MIYIKFPMSRRERTSAESPDFDVAVQANKMIRDR